MITERLASLSTGKSFSNLNTAWVDISSPRPKSSFLTKPLSLMANSMHRRSAQISSPFLTILLDSGNEFRLERALLSLTSSTAQPYFETPKFGWSPVQANSSSMKLTMKSSLCSENGSQPGPSPELLSIPKSQSKHQPSGRRSLQSTAHQQLLNLPTSLEAIRPNYSQHKSATDLSCCFGVTHSVTT